MGKQRVRDLELKEKKRDEKKETKEEPSQRPEAVAGARKWKGKDWFVIFSPRMFGENVIGETPTTNPKTLIGRNIEVSLSDLLGVKAKGFYRVVLKVDNIDNKVAHTRFEGYSTLKEHIMRVVRKRSQKIENILYVKTKNDWRLQVSSIAILNRNTETAVKKKVRDYVTKSLQEKASSSSIDDFLKAIISGNLQRFIKKSGSRVYPIRFFEIAKIEVKGVPEEK
jgi:small subunit ribosomal protein S3Ae